MKPRSPLVLLTLLVPLATACRTPATPARPSAPPDPFAASLGFVPRVTRAGELEVPYWVSTAGGALDEGRRLPLLVHLQGSGPVPLFYGERPRLGTSLLFLPREFPDHHFVVIGKPGIPFHAAERSLDSPEFERMNSLDDRVLRVRAVLADLRDEPWVDRGQIALVGHSEGSDVAPWAALEDDLVTHVAILAPGVLSQMFDFLLQERKRALRGEISPAQADANVEAIRAGWAEVFADPLATDRRWWGDTHLRCSTFFRPALDALVRLEIPIFALVCRDDANTPCESGEILALEFLRRGKTNLTYELWPVDHYLVERGEDETTLDRRPEAAEAVRAWLAAGRER